MFFFISTFLKNSLLEVTSHAKIELIQFGYIKCIFLWRIWLSLWPPLANKSMQIFLSRHLSILSVNFPLLSILIIFVTVIWYISMLVAGKSWIWFIRPWFRERKEQDVETHNSRISLGKGKIISWNGGLSCC